MFEMVVTQESNEDNVDSLATWTARLDGTPTAAIIGKPPSTAFAAAQSWHGRTAAAKNDVTASGP
jgi:hypothetical protein